MPDYEITTPAFHDLDEIREYLERKASIETADHVEEAIFAAFDELVRLAPLGHKRSDTRQSALLFHNVFRYVIVFRREPVVTILRVVHGARNLKRIL